jgi:hypothetical protein
VEDLQEELPLVQEELQHRRTPPQVEQVTNAGAGHFTSPVEGGGGGGGAGGVGSASLDLQQEEEQGEMGQFQQLQDHL